jgi:DNA invertase Pin-like site-specific DNA recombinase
LRVVAYARESADRPLFAQQEEIRRHAADNGLSVIATCQDPRAHGEGPARQGYLALLGVIASGSVDGVLLPGLSTLSADQIVQEIMLWDLRSRGVRVVSTVESDMALLDADQPGASRGFIRDVLARVGEHARSLGAHRPEPPTILPDGDVMIHILRADEEELREA